MDSCGPAPSTDCRSFAAGDLILSCDPFVWALESGEYKQRCAYCLHQDDSLLTCSGCRVHRYCNKSCQKADWKMEHKLECKTLDDMKTRKEAATGNSSSVYTVLAGKMASKIAVSTTVEVPGQGPRSAQEFMDMLPRDPTPPKQERRCCAFPGCSSPVVQDAPYSGISAYNAQPMYHTMSGSVEIGFAVYPVTPRHHMTPVCWDVNVVINFRGRRMFIHATEDIPVYTGMKDLRYSDIRLPFFLTRERRRNCFEKIHGFPCTCRKCTEEYDAEINPLKCMNVRCSNRIPSDQRALDPCSACGTVNSERLKEFRRFLQRHQAMMPNAPTESRTMALCLELDAAGILQPVAHFRFVCGWELPRGYFDASRFEEGWKMTQELVNCVREVYPKYEEYRAVLLMKATRYAAGALHEHVLAQAGKMSTAEKKRWKTMSTLASAVMFGYCREAIHILRVLNGEESRDARIAAAFYQGVQSTALHNREVLTSRK
ncbi:N-lysine methyltransferase SMYD2-B-like [Paramacrobiotus metropolitanus]|uniref:N-lysine methyltransferase SMYD2-B-like n=1 Tax=Paramacrobiotus metropolitanus TaxID=2943436 RepID=UPI0024459224|nr:N-lysine methyltransferase SMYD2-B-like [Paramacrobiotus metropolitanus]XP_055349245.1 N-lysine methyltransferase SMYD2-B-like [Paramacrobiotus metropolitanus]XP_055349246.1 N-lysine methyltransferase SMYD2-B-like [Paramacrobiotus metropolitanus]XP_055349247.1 N-lysine methyltransferase SMYD2-B-like [Paramacrobiotus metropolitanus]XP_055349249.1 N-lysine methyltransferase SMYD2-B-like [Paramacrobiotus metropolitanus]